MGTIFPLVAFEGFKNVLTNRAMLAYGSTHKLNIKSIYELDKDYFDAAMKRIKEETAQESLF